MKNIKKFDFISIVLLCALLIVAGFITLANIQNNNVVDVGVDKPAPTVTGDQENDVGDQPDDKANNNDDDKNGTDDDPKTEDNPDSTVMENDAFKIVSPKPDQVVGNTFILKGKARVFEANFQYKLEDGHNVLAEGFITANKGAPEWGDFETEISFTGATSPSAVLIIYEGSPKDGSLQHQLFIPLKLENWE